MRVARAVGFDLLAVILGFALSSLGLTVASAARVATAPTTVPSVSLISPTDGQAVSGNVVLSATAEPNTQSLQFQVGGSDVGPQITSGACSTAWNSTGFSDGTYAVTVVAIDSNGMSTAATPVTVTVENTPPNILSIQTSSIAATSAVVTWSTSQPASSGVDFGPMSYDNSLLDGHLVTSHSATLGNLSPSTTYHFRIQSTNAAGVGATSQDQIFTTGAGGSSGVINPPQSPAPAPAPAPAAGVIQGTLLNPSSDVVPFAQVLLVGNGVILATTTSDGAGHFQFTGLGPGTYQVYGVAGGVRWLFETVQVTASSPTGLIQSGR